MAYIKEEDLTAAIVHRTQSFNVSRLRLSSNTSAKSPSWRVRASTYLDDKGKSEVGLAYLVQRLAGKASERLVNHANRKAHYKVREAFGRLATHIHGNVLDEQAAETAFDVVEDLLTEFFKATFRIADRLERQSRFCQIIDTKSKGREQQIAYLLNDLYSFSL